MLKKFRGPHNRLSAPETRKKLAQKNRLRGLEIPLRILLVAISSQETILGHCVEDFNSRA